GRPSSRAPRRRASVAFPKPSEPENSSVCATRSCDSICSMDCTTCGLPQKFSNMSAHDLPDVALDGVDLLPAVHQFHPPRLAGGQCVIGFVDPAVEVERLVVHPGLAVRLGEIARPGA